MKKNLILLASLFALNFAPGCKKDDDTKYQPAGNYVTTGTNNNTVQTFSFTISTWTSAGSFWYADYYGIPGNTNMNGAVMVYQDLGSGDFLALPFTVNDIETYYSFNTNTILEMAVRSASGTTVISNPGTLNYKCVIIPPGARMKNPNVNMNNYNEVKKVFNLIN